MRLHTWCSHLEWTRDIPHFLTGQTRQRLTLLVSDRSIAKSLSRCNGHHWNHERRLQPKPDMIVLVCELTAIDVDQIHIGCTHKCIQTGHVTAHNHLEIDRRQNSNIDLWEPSLSEPAMSSCSVVRARTRHEVIQQITRSNEVQNVENKPAALNTVKPRLAGAQAGRFIFAVDSYISAADVVREPSSESADGPRASL